MIGWITIAAGVWLASDGASNGQYAGAALIAGISTENSCRSPAPRHWKGPQQALFKAVLNHHLERRGVERIDTEVAGRRRPRNTRVRIAPGTDLPRIAP